MNKKNSNRFFALLMMFVMLFGLLPPSALAATEDIHAEVQSIEVKTADGLADAVAIGVDSMYTVQVTVRNMGTYSANPSVTIYEIRDDTDIILIDQAKSSGVLDPDSNATLAFSWAPDTAGELELRAVASTVVDGIDTQLDLMERPITVMTAEEKLQAYYKRVGVSYPLSALGIRSLINDPELAGAVFSTPYDGSGGYATLVPFGSADGLAAIDQMAMGQNPRSYQRNVPGTTNTVQYDLIAALLNSLNDDGTFKYSTNSSPGTANGGCTELYSILALEMFYGGDDWSKIDENGIIRQTRAGAIQKFLSYFKDSVKTDGSASTNWSVTNGADYGRYYNSGNIPAFTGIQQQLGMQLDAVVLLSRWLNDDTIVTVSGQTEPLKNVAAREISGILTTYKAIFNGTVTTGANQTAQTNLRKAVREMSQNMAGYISALVAAGEKDTADELGLVELLDNLRMDKINPDRLPSDETQRQEMLAQIALRDGAYRTNLQGLGYGSSGTARAAIALGDYSNNRSMMATLTLDLAMSEMDTVAWDLDTLSIPDTVSANLTLPTRGTYGSTITWKSSNSMVIDPDNGFVTRPVPEDGDIVVKLTAAAEFGSASDTRDFYVTVTDPLPDDQEKVNADILALTVPVFTTENLTLPTTGANGSSISWSSADSGIIAGDGTVTKTDNEQTGTLTATVSNGEATGQKLFVVTVGKNVTNDDIVTKAVYQMRAYYETHRDLTKGYWNIWAAKAVVGDDFDRYNFAVYNVKNHNSTSEWKGTDYGGVILQILAQGDSPYNYKGVNYVESMLSYINRQNGSDPYYWGMFGEPIFLAMALDATGEMTPEMFRSVRGTLQGQFNLNYGPDLGGWAMVPLASHLNDGGEITTVISNAFNCFKSLNVAALDRDSHSPNYRFIALGYGADNWSYPMSNNCVLIGSVAAAKAGYEGFDLQSDSEWLQGGDGGIVEALYEATYEEKNGPYNDQISIGFGDLYHGDNVWTSVGVTHEKLIDLLSAVKPVAESGGANYTAVSFQALRSAYADANAFKDAEYGFGEVYFNLLDTYNGLKHAGSISVRVFGNVSRELIFDTAYINGTGNTLQILQQAARENRFSQTVTGGKIIEIGGLTADSSAEWRVYNGQARITDLGAPLAEGSDLVFKFCADYSTLDQNATLDEHLVREVAAMLTIDEANDGVVEGPSVVLPTSGPFGTGIRWISNKPLTINPDTGEVTAGTQDIKVSLTATVSGPNGAALDVPFDLTVKGTDPAPAEKSYAWVSVTDPKPPAGRPSVYFAKQKLEIEPGETAFTILEKTGLELRVNRNTQYGLYVEAIEGYGEFDGGQLSGWVCKVNSEGITKSSALVPISDGNIVEWLYTRDLGRDVGIKMTGGGNKTEDDSVMITPSIKVTNGEAKVSVTSNQIIDAIGLVKENGIKTIVIAAEIKGTAQKVSVELPKDSLSLVASKSDADLAVETPVGNVMIPNSVLASVVSQASGGNVTISLESVASSNLTAAQKEVVGDDPVYDISILSGGKNISSFNGGSITISLPYTLKAGEDPSGVTVWYLDDKGELNKITCTYNKATGPATFTTNHLSYYVVGWSEAWKNPFADIEDIDWFYNSVEFAVRNGLLNGTTDATFSPKSHMTRAMLVTALYRLEGSPVVTGTNSFIDVKNGDWYANAVTWVNTNKISEGIGNELFGTNNNLTREQLATILYNYAKYKGKDVTKTAELNTFTDTPDISGWARPAVKWANAEGLITGRTTTTLVPGGSASRAEVATILQRFVKEIEE